MMMTMRLLLVCHVTYLYVIRPHPNFLSAVGKYLKVLESLTFCVSGELAVCCSVLGGLALGFKRNISLRWFSYLLPSLFTCI